MDNQDSHKSGANDLNESPFGQEEDDDFMTAASKDEEISKKCFCCRIWSKYDRNFMFAYTTQYANFGMKFLTILAL